MGLISYFYKDIAVDLGTANTLIILNDKIVIDEPSIIAIDRNTNKMIAVGKAAMQMHEKTHDNIKTIRPLKDGVIADFHAAELMIQGMIRMLNKQKINFVSPFFNKIVVCIPSGTTDVEKRAVRDSAAHTGAREVFMIYEPIAAAIGIGVNIADPIGCMIVDIGGGTTEIAVIALAGIACDQSIKIAGNAFNNDILDYMRKQHNLLIGERTAEQIKIAIGAVWPDLPEPPADYEVHGKDLMTGIPKIISINYREIAGALEESAVKIDNAVLKALEMAPPELASDIYKNGIHLTGGGALLRGLDKRLHHITKLPVYVAGEPLQAVVRGTAVALKNIEAYRGVLMV
ncbi:rod shape-determining protein [Cardinium endosymbiont of Culicoides punctatus]|uniref:rod shape-determining protein n=1 Tax=Cardinium endosymbiont of Culicoides punctatus TaxID=2304601 RepID=UPI001058A37B|nr:rod shape-determining protein [Cardinium endosymbiont of Culicoides punctatus]TDG95722.1 Rod shape-determining protein MreB [Cardinium endosymbiont of Culicoides punctatus]